MIFIKREFLKIQELGRSYCAVSDPRNCGGKKTRKDGLISVFLLFTLLLWAEGQVLGEMKGI